MITPDDKIFPLGEEDRSFPDEVKEIVHYTSKSIYEPHQNDKEKSRRRRQIQAMFEKRNYGEK